MRIKLGLTEISMTNVPDEKELNKEPVYYVYEWFVKESDKIFYIGKGKGSRYKSEGKKERNYFFNLIKDNFECSYRIVDDKLTEHEALKLEENLMQQRYKEGHVLTNIQVVNAPSVFGKPEVEYMTTPKIYPSLVEKHYFNIEEQSFDKINKDKLKYAYIPQHTIHYGTEEIYFKKYDNLDTKQKLNGIDKFIQISKDGIENLGGRVYKTKAKSVKSIIYFNPMPYHNYQRDKEDGYDVYHLIDVLNFLDSEL